MGHDIAAVTLNCQYSKHKKFEKTVCGEPCGPLEEEQEERKACLVGKAKDNVDLFNWLENHFDFTVFQSQKGIEYREEPNMLFIFKDFESPDFKYLNSSEKLIISPIVVSHCVALNKPLPNIRPNRPLYCCSMVGMRFCMKNYNKADTRRAVDLIHFMGGSARKDYSPRDILISGSADTSSFPEKDRAAFFNEKIVLTLEWIQQCWRHRDNIYFSAQDLNLQRKYQLKCFQGLCLFFVGFSDDSALEEMKQTAVKHGGAMANTYQEATHVIHSDNSIHIPPIAPEGNGRQEKKKEFKQVWHVSVEWFWKSVCEERCQPETSKPQSQDGTTSVQQHLRPLQARENQVHASSSATAVARRQTLLPSPHGGDENVRCSRRNSSKASLDNLESSNTSSVLPEHMFSSDNLDFGCTAKRNDKRYQVCMEILETEENYIRVLHLVLDIFKAPLERMAAQNDELLSRNEISTIFGKLPSIIQVHTEILDKLTCHMKLFTEKNYEPLLGKVWAHNTSQLQRVYPPYINNYDNILNALEMCDQTKPKFHAFLKMAESRKECQKNSLKDMLIRPVQRIPSVLLLLQELLKRTEKNNTDYKYVKSAVEGMKTVLQKTNESRRKVEICTRSLEVCNQIDNMPTNLITGQREFIQSIDVVVLEAGGVLHKHKGRTIGLFLFHDLVVLAKGRAHNFSKLGACNSTMLSGGSINGSFMERSGGGGTLARQMTFSTLRRHKEKKPYKFICHHLFSAFRSMEVIRSWGIFILKLRDEKADELCAFQLTNGCGVEVGVDFFQNLIKKNLRDTTRELLLEELTVDNLEYQYANRPEECETIKKALSLATEFYTTGSIRRPSQLRRAVSNVSLGFSSLQRFTSKSRINNISEMHEKSIKFH